MAKILFLVVLTNICFDLNHDTNSRLIHTENSIYYDIDRNELEQEKVQIFVGLVDKNLGKVTQQNAFNFDFFKEGKAFDLFDYWENRGKDSYHILLTKVAFLHNKQVDFFNEQLLGDLSFLKSKMPDYELEQVEENKFHMNCGFFAPSFDFELSFCRPPFIAPKLNAAQALIKHINPELDEPVLSVIQHNHTFGKVMMHKTSKMSVGIANFYRFDENRTLEVNYTLSYIHELPPKFIGGQKMLINEIKAGITDLIDNTRNVCATM
ncbi:MAG: hypothetical protein AAGI07_15585 [Bacteroidota bacterium]